MNRHALMGELRGLIECATDDELRVVHTIVSRFMGLGRRNYGPLNLATDKRDFAKEMSEEAIDALIYWAAEVVQRAFYSTPPDAGSASPPQRALDSHGGVTFSTEEE